VRSLRLPFSIAALLLAGDLAAFGQAHQQPNQAAEPVAQASGGRLHAWSQQWHEFVDLVHMHSSRSNAWPEPFVVPDRESVRSPFRIMADNGWREQNTFSDFLFSDENELNYAGREKLKSILTQLPPHRRQFYIVEADRPDQTASRVASVYQHMAEVSPGCAPYPVFTTRLEPRYGDGRYLNNVDHSYDSTLPDPRLPIPSYDTIFAGVGATGP